MSATGILSDFTNPHNLAGHLSYILIIISMLMRSMRWLRFFAILSGLVALSYFAITRTDYVSAFWETIFVAVNVVQIALLWFEQRAGQFSPDQTAYIENGLLGLRPARSARLLKISSVETVPANTRLLSEGVVPDRLIYVVAGELAVTRNGVAVGTCIAGDYVGEMAFISHGTANADVDTLSECTLFVFDRPQLDKLTARFDDIRLAIHAGISRNLLAKINRLNEGTVRQAAVTDATMRNGGALT